MNAFRYSADGLAAAWHHEDAFRQEMVLAGGDGADRTGASSDAARKNPADRRRDPEC